MNVKRGAIRSLVAVGAMMAATFVAASPASAASLACDTGGGFQVCIFKNSDGYSVSACNNNTNGAGTNMHVVLRSKTNTFTPVTGDKVLYGVSDSSRSCLTLRSREGLDNSVKHGSAAPSGSGIPVAGVENRLS